MDRLKMLAKILGKSFEMKLERLEKAFASASSSFYAELRAVKKAHDAFQIKVDAGTAKWEETTDDGDRYDYGDELSERRDDAEEALLTLRKAFTFLIYHQWERLAQHWGKLGKSPNHEDLVKAMKAAAVPLDEPGLEILRLLVNTLKHNSSKYGPPLYRARPDLFKAGFVPDEINPVTGTKLTSNSWSDQIELSDANIDAFIEIVRNSAPT